MGKVLGVNAPIVTLLVSALQWEVMLGKCGLVNGVKSVDPV